MCWWWNADPKFCFSLINFYLLTVFIDFLYLQGDFAQILWHFQIISCPFRLLPPFFLVCLFLYSSLFAVHCCLFLWCSFFHFVSSCHRCCLSVSLTPPVFLDIVLRQSCGLMVTWLCGVYCIVRQLLVLPFGSPDRVVMDEWTHCFDTDATVSNNKSLLCSVKFL